MYGLKKLQLLMAKQINRGQDGAGIGIIKLDPQFGNRYIGDREVTRTVNVARLKVRILDTTQGVPGTPTITSASPANGTYSPATVTWSWGAVTANPGGSANLTYEVSYNGGGWQSVSTDTSYSLGNRGTGDHTLAVRAVNKAGASAASAAVTVSLAEEPIPVAVYPVKGQPYTPSGCGSTGHMIAANTTGIPNGSYTGRVYTSGSSSGPWTLRVSSPWTRCRR